MRTLTRSLALLLLMMASIFTAAAQQTDADRAPMEDLIIPADELAADIEKGTTIIGGELAPQLESGASFTSGVIEAPIPFNAVVPHWTGDNAEAVSLQVRTGPDGETWGDWVAVHANHDWMEPGEAEIVGEMVLVPDAGVTHRFVQVQVLFNSPDQDLRGLPQTSEVSLSRLRLTFIDTHDGPTADELLDLQSEIDKDAPLLPESLTNYPKPFVVSRAAWCQHADCNYTEGLEYHPVSHLIVHHTVSNNASADWPAVVRAIWNFHTYSRGWGDIGYNYLVDPNGVLYEGHNGGDDVVGTHASGANTGSMALALLGTFTAYSPGIRPPDAMLNSAVELLSWAADRRDINVFDAGNDLPNIDWGLPRLMGHRDVYGTTECPGDQAHLLIPWLREQIAGRIGLSDPFLYADDQTTAFTKSASANWFVPPYLCGFNNHAWYTWSVNSPASSTNWGEWRPNVPAAGRYRIDVYAPYCRTGRGETGSATYTITHAGGTSTRTISHQANIGLWMTLGEYNLSQGNGNVIRLTDLTGDSGLGVWFDAVRLLPLSTPPPPPPPPVPNNLDPAPNNWRTNRSVAFAWQIANPDTVTVTTLQVAVDPGFGNVLVNQSWFGAPTSHSHTFGQDYPDLYWRVLVAWSGGPLISSLPTRFQLDATPPQSAVGSPLYFLPRLGRYVVSWSGDDGLSGLDRFQVDFRPAGGAWTRWLTDTRLRSAAFAPPAAGQVYEFRTQAVDAAGNVEAASNTADASTTGAISLSNTLFLPSTVR